MQEISSKNQYLIIFIVFLGFVIFCLGVRVGYGIVKENFQKEKISKNALHMKSS